MTKIYVIKWSQICTRTIRSGVVGIPKYIFLNACKAGYFNIFVHAKNTTSDGPRLILRPLYYRLKDMARYVGLLLATAEGF